MIDVRQPIASEPGAWIGIAFKERREMNSNLNHGSARIYQFPAGGRAAPGGRRHDETKSATDRDSPPVNEVACGDCWYHEAAIQQAKPPWEH